MRSLVFPKEGIVILIPKYMKYVKYPSGNWVTYDVTGANRVKKVRKGQAGDNYYLQGATYTPAGARKSAVVGINGASGLWGEAWSYNNHLQAKSLSVQDPGTTLLHLRWAYTEGANQTTLEDSGWQNNGNLHFEQVQYPTPSGTSTILRTYVYDLTNRVTSFSEGYGGASQSFNYDGFGNIWQTASSGVPQLRQNSSSWYIQSGDGANRLSNTEYDAAGNQTQLSVTGGAEATTAFYDAENKVASIMSGAGEVARYTYDAEGRRVAKTVGPVTTYFVYGVDGQLMAEYGGPSETTKTHYYVTDYLGSTRMILNAAGGCEQRIDYAPFGGEIPRSGVACYEQDLSNKPMFTGQMRDEESHAGTETGMDYFGARYMWAVQGRWMSPDEPLVDQYPENPQSWNLYAYARSNPLRNRDLDGRICIFGVGNTCDEKVPPPPPPPPPPAPALSPNGTPAQGTQPAPATGNGNFALTVNNRQAQIPGGSALAAVGVNHQWITTSTGASVGLGNQQGVPQSDVPGVETYVVDHTGQVPESTTTYTNVDQGAAMSYLQPGQRVGNWIPGLSDCNTWTANVVRNSTPHDIVRYEYTPYVGYRSVVSRNVVVYSDGSIRRPGGR